RDRIGLGDGIAGFGQNEIGTDDERDVIPELFLAGELDQLGWFTGVEVRGDPGRLFAFDAALVKLVAGALENEKAMAKLLEFLCKFFVDRKGIGRKEKILFGEKALGGEGRLYRGEIRGMSKHRIEAPNSKLQHPEKLQIPNIKSVGAFSSAFLFGGSLA